jgi:hypothetical protein
VAGLAIAFAAATGKGSSEVLFSGQSAGGPLISHSASYTAGALLLLLACEGIAYSVSMSSFRAVPPSRHRWIASRDRVLCHQLMSSIDVIL